MASVPRARSAGSHRQNLFPEALGLRGQNRREAAARGSCVDDVTRSGYLLIGRP